MTGTPDSVKKLVHDLLDAGCDLTAVGEGYVIGDPEDIEARPRIEGILNKFGPRLHLMTEISAYIRSLGRFHDP